MQIDRPRPAGDSGVLDVSAGLVSPGTARGSRRLAGDRFRGGSTGPGYRFRLRDGAGTISFHTVRRRLSRGSECGGRRCERRWRSRHRDHARPGRVGAGQGVLIGRWGRAWAVPGSTENLSRRALGVGRRRDRRRQGRHRGGNAQPERARAHLRRHARTPCTVVPRECGYRLRRASGCGRPQSGHPRRDRDRTRGRRVADLDLRRCDGPAVEPGAGLRGPSPRRHLDWNWRYQ